MKYLIALAVVAVALLWIVSGTEEQVNELEQASHCKMVQIYKDTDGAYGWPNYNNTDCAGYGDTAAGSSGSEK